MMQNDLLVLAALAASGALYDIAVVNVIETRLPAGHGVTAYEVVGGVTFTLLGFGAIAGWEAMATAFVCFVATGLPMILGAHRRAEHVKGTR